MITLKKTNMADKATHLQFGQHHIPALEAGDYSLTANQTLSIDSYAQVFGTTVNFSVQGERFSIRPTEIHSVFPPENSLGEYTGVLPHVLIDRTTLPWERHAVPFVEGEAEVIREKKKETPWLALLLFRDGELEIMGQGPNQPGNKEKLEAETGYIMNLGDLVNNFSQKPDYATAKKAWPGISLETGQHAADRVSLIFVKKKNLQPLLPSWQELHYLAHTRQGTDDGGKLVGDEMAVVIGNRLPEAGANSVVHLVSVEHRYTENGFDFGTAGDSDPVPLVSLKSWRFSSLSHKHTFRGLLLHLNQEMLFRWPVPAGFDMNATQTGLPTVLKTLFEKAEKPLSKKAKNTDRAKREIILKDYHFLIGDSGRIYNQAGNFLFELTDISTDQKIVNGIIAKQHPIPSNTKIRPAPKACWWVEDAGKLFFIREEYGYLIASKLELDHSPTLRLPETGNATANQFLQQGYAPMPHFLRRGGKTVSWYRGPLLTSEKTAFNLGKDVFSVHTADELVRYHTNSGMFDVTYAAAWELGRLLALRSKRFSVGLYKWRRAHARAAVQAEHGESHLHLPFSGNAPEPLAVFPTELNAWLDRLWDLEGIPFNYLVPDEKMLPPESLRFFTLDPDWMACLVHGAFSIGQDTGTDHWEDASDLHPVSLQLSANDAISGFILKSEVVSGWPGMQVEVMGMKNGTKQPLEISKRLIAPGILLCLFEGEATQVDFHLQPEVLHFGFHQEEDGGAFVKSPRDDNGKETEVLIDLSNPPGDKIILKKPGDTGFNGVLNIENLFDSIKNAWQQGLQIAGEFGSAQLALSLIEGVDKVRFIRSKAASNKLV